MSSVKKAWYQVLSLFIDALKVNPVTPFFWRDTSCQVKNLYFGAILLSARQIVEVKGVFRINITSNVAISQMNACALGLAECIRAGL